MDRTQEFRQPPAVVLLPSGDTVPTGLGVIRSLGVMGVPVVAVGQSRWTPAARSRYVADFRRLPDGGEEETIEWLADLGRSLQPRPVLFVSADRQVVLVHEYRSALEASYDYPFLSPDTVALCIEKPKTCEAARGAGVTAPRMYVVDSDEAVGAIMESPPLPCVIRPSCWVAPNRRPVVEHGEFRERFRAKAVRARTREELLAIIERCRGLSIPAVVQEEVVGPTSEIYTATVHVQRTGQMSAIYTYRKNRQLPSDCGTATCIESVDAPEIVALTSRFLSSIGYWGIAELEFKRDPQTGEYNLLEINARPPANISAATAAGANVVYAAYSDLSGTCGDAQSSSVCEPGVKWIELLRDVEHFWKYRRGDHAGRPLTLREYLHSLSGRREYAFLSPRDPIPGLLHLARWSSELAGRLGRKAARGLGRSAGRTPVPTSSPTARAQERAG